MKQIKNELRFKATSYITARPAAPEVAKQSISMAMAHAGLITHIQSSSRVRSVKN